MPQDASTREQDSTVTVTQISDTPQEPQEQPQEPVETPDEQTPGDEPQEPQEEPQEPAKDSESPGLWEGVSEDHPLRTEVSSLRSESAARRAEVRRLQEANEELRQQLEAAKSPEDFQAAVAEYDQRVKEAQLEAARERTARKYGLPDALVTRLAGQTEEELEADAQQLQSLFTAQATPPPAPQGPARGGLDPTEQRVDPAEAAAAIRQRSATAVRTM